MKHVFGTMLIATTLALPAWADDSVDAAIGGGIGGAIGAVIGNEVGGSDGAILGGALGGAGGAAIATDDDRDYRRDDYRYGDHHRAHDGHRGQGRFCPPGQAKKGRC